MLCSECGNPFQIEHKVAHFALCLLSLQKCTMMSQQLQIEVELSGIAIRHQLNEDEYGAALLLCSKAFYPKVEHSVELPLCIHTHSLSLSPNASDESLFDTPPPPPPPHTHTHTHTHTRARTHTHTHTQSHTHTHTHTHTHNHTHTHTHTITHTQSHTHTHTHTHTHNHTHTHTSQPDDNCAYA